MRTTNRWGRPSALRAAACVDIENIVNIGPRRLLVAEGQSLLNVVAAHTCGMPVRVAGGRAVLRAYMPVLAGLPWGLTLVGQEPDAADADLLRAGLDFVETGVTDLWVASGDHAFTELAGWTRVHVIAHPNHLSRKLRLAATTVTYLPSLTAATSSRKAG